MRSFYPTSDKTVSLFHSWSLFWTLSLRKRGRFPTNCTQRTLRSLLLLFLPFLTVSVLELSDFTSYNRFLFQKVQSASEQTWFHSVIQELNFYFLQHPSSSSHWYLQSGSSWLLFSEDSGCRSWTNCVIQERKIRWKMKNKCFKFSKTDLLFLKVINLSITSQQKEHEKIFQNILDVFLCLFCDNDVPLSSADVWMKTWTLFHQSFIRFLLLSAFTGLRSFTASFCSFCCYSGL